MFSENYHDTDLHVAMPYSWAINTLLFATLKISCNDYDLDWQISGEWEEIILTQMNTGTPNRMNQG